MCVNYIIWGEKTKTTNELNIIAVKNITGCRSQYCLQRHAVLF